MTSKTELPDLDRLEALARAATPGPWVHRHDPGNPVGVQHGVKLPGEFGAWIGDCLDNADRDTNGAAAGERNAAFIAAANPAAVLQLIALARRQPVPALRPTDDELWDSTLRDRDNNQEWADKLAGAIAGHFGVDIGEHSNVNCPWHEALEAIESAPPAFQPEGEAQQATLLRAAHRATIEEVAQVLESAAAHNRIKGRTVLERQQQDRADRLRAILAAPAAQHAEGGAQARTESQLMDQWAGAAKALEERAEQAAAVKSWQQRVAESGKRECADLAVDCLMAEVADLRALLKRPMLDEDAYLAAQSQGAQATELCIGFANNDQGVHVNVMQRHGDGTTIVLHQGRVPAGDSFARFALAAKAEAPAVAAVSVETEMADRLRRILANHPGTTVQVSAKTLASAADECDRFYNGMMNWKANAQAKDRIIIDLRAAPSAPGTPEAPQTAAARDVLAERQRQVDQEGWHPDQDDDYDDGQLSMAAACYAMQGNSPNYGPPKDWPWDREWWKPTDDRRNLVKACALILADIERLDRAAQIDGGQEDPAPADCSGTPSSCPDNEGHGCHCSDKRLDGGQGEEEKA